MPPSAPANDNAATRKVCSLPRTSECLSSRATTKKNRVINPSLIHSLRERVKSSAPKCSPMGISQNAKNGTDHFEFDRVRAATVATNNMTPVATLIFRIRANGLVSRSAISVGRSVPSSFIVL
jgi:hypothetical protein